MSVSYFENGYAYLPYCGYAYAGTVRTGFTPSQASVPRISFFPSQVRLAQYNITKLRVLMDFPSRGASAYAITLNAWGQSYGLGLNWSANHTEVSSTSDFDVKNVNTDIVEQYWRSPSGSIATPSVLRCDSEVSGITFDTLALLGTNFTTSAVITVQMSATSNFIVPITVATLYGDRDGNVVWVSPTLPTASYRYIRVAVSDPSNTDGFLKIGTIVFGNAVILSEECITNTVTWEPRHYVDMIDTEGQTSAQNDRGIKNSVGLEFKSINFSSYDFTQLKNVFSYVRTSLKALWIPTPNFPKRFMVFGKMTSMPRETHNALSEDADYIDYSVNVDEAR